MGSLQQSARKVRVLPKVIDEHASNFPDSLWASIPRSEALDEGWVDITYKTYSQCINDMAQWIEDKIGLGENRETLGFICVNDIRYPVFIFAAMKAGYKALLVSPRNSTEGQLSLLQNTQCSKFLYSEEMQSVAKELKDAKQDLNIVQIPSVNSLLDSQKAAKDYPGTISEDEYETVLVLHTSGSTGLPKPIYIRNGWLATGDILPTMSTPPGRQNILDGWSAPGRSMLMVSPWFHTAAFLTLMRVFQRSSFILPGGTSRPMTSDFIVQALSQKNPDTALFTPSLLEDLSATDEGLNALKHIKHIWFGGGPLAVDAGDRVNEVTDLRMIIGSTEAAIINSLLPLTKQEWNYFEWAPGAGVEMIPAEDGLYEMTIKRSKDHRYQGAFYSFPELDRWHTKDLFEQHHEKPGLWHYSGRKDDVIVFNNGEKFNPVDFEKTIESHRLVQGALVVGQARFQAGLIIEPRWEMLSDDMKAENLLEILWPLVEKANAAAPGHGRVWKSKVAFTKRDKPFSRAPKGSLIRRASAQLYESEINALYSNEDYDEKLGTLEPTADLPSIRDFVRRAIAVTIPDIQEDLQDDADIFSFGVDSLQTLGLSSALSHALPHHEGKTDASVPARVIYRNPRIKDLAQTIWTQLHGETLPEGQASQISRKEKMANMVTKYTSDLHEQKHHDPEQRSYRSVALTGSTGSLGSYILELLIKDPNVERIYCLNRSADGEARQRQRFESLNISRDFTKVRFLQTDFAKDHFGLPKSAYVDLLQHTNVFIHNAWAVDFNLSLESFENTHVAGVRHVVDFSLASPFRPHIVFVSSISSVGSYRDSASVPEVLFEDDTVALPQGYGESKQVATRILSIAAERCGVPVSIVRAGQLGGPASEKGVWNKQEWLPSLVATSKAIGRIPRTLGNFNTVDWVPIDVAAEVLLDLVRTRSTDQQMQPLFRTKSGRQTQQQPACDVFHVVNPKTVGWEKLVPAVQNFYAESGGPVEAVDFGRWIDELKSLPMTKEEAESKPGMKLLDFYEALNAEGGGLPGLETRHTEDCSQAMRTLQPVDKNLIENWCRQWAY
ncbi:MAG: putative NRPS-like protein biosynthetic cluster [Bogoriella megaspora]|nr:MAG: putative NRPS-like protein biosynthetic cluster [Bogoriella megaspora]